MAKNIFTLSENHNPNYLCTICRIGTLEPIEGSDRLLKTVVNGYDIVVANTTNVGDIVAYFPVETSICEQMLSANNLYEMAEYEKNSNSADVFALKQKALEALNKGDKETYDNYNAEAKAMVGFFNKHGRVRIIKLRGCPSCGFITPVTSLENAFPNLVDTNWEEVVGETFDTIGETKVCWKYVPPIKECRSGGGSGNKRNKAIKRFDKLIEGQFEFHYDTQMLASNIWKLSPDDVVTITVKCHGTSAIFSNILCNRKLSMWEKVKKFFGCNVPTTEYSNIYSSRSVVKNRYLNPNANDFYGSDVWGDVNTMISPFISEGMSVYGEIVGYVTGSDKMIQKNHDYGCKPGEWKFMPYRITNTNVNGDKFEWNVQEVHDWTVKLINENPDIANHIMPIEIVYHGEFKNLYPDINVENHWHENVLARMKEDKDRFLMEEDEPMCTMFNDKITDLKRLYETSKANGASKKDLKTVEKEIMKYEAMKAPREGVVVRIDNDPMGARAWKLKTYRHYHMEAAAHDAGEVDMEEAESTSEE